MAESAISILAVDKWFGSTHAVRGLDLVVPMGSLCGFLGPNGAGKSTTIRMIMSIIYPDSGTIRVLGGSALKSKDRIGYLPEERGLYRKMRVGEFLSFVARLKGVPSRGLSERVKAWLDRVQLADVIRKRCQELSKGMQQKVQLVAAMIHQPQLLILDEPFTGLDPVNSALLIALIRELNRQGTTVIFSTHILHQAEQLCDRIFLINHGVKLLDSTLDEIRRRFDPRTIVAEPMDGAVNLKLIEGVAAAAPLGDAGAMELTLARDADPHRTMQAILAVHPMRSIELRRPTLDEVFVELVMEDEGAAAAQRARELLSHA